MAEQLSFDLTARPALGREAFFVSETNAMALAMVDDWQNWSQGKLMLTGPLGAGKTHLAHVWAEQSGATLIRAAMLRDSDVAPLIRAPICVEDVQDLAADSAAQTRMFHLHNLALAEGVPLLMTGIGAPSQWDIALPDLASRLQGTTLVRIEPPDEALLGAVLVKLFDDRQISPSPTAISYLARHAPRRFDLAQQIVEDMDRAAFASGAGFTQRLAKQVLDAIIAARDAGDPPRSS